MSTKWPLRYPVFRVELTEDEIAYLAIMFHERVRYNVGHNPILMELNLDNKFSRAQLITDRCAI